MQHEEHLACAKRKSIVADDLPFRMQCDMTSSNGSSLLRAHTVPYFRYRQTVFAWHHGIDRGEHMLSRETEAGRWPPSVSKKSEALGRPPHRDA